MKASYTKNNKQDFEICFIIFIVYIDFTRCDYFYAKQCSVHLLRINYVKHANLMQILDSQRAFLNIPHLICNRGHGHLHYLVDRLLILVRFPCMPPNYSQTSVCARNPPQMGIEKRKHHNTIDHIEKVSMLLGF